MDKHLTTRNRRDWDLVLVELCASPGALVRSVRATVIEWGGLLLEQGYSHPYSAAIRFELLSKHVIEIYELLLQSGILLSTEAHEQFSPLLQCARYGVANTRVNLTLYSNRCGEEFDCFDCERHRSQNGKDGPCHP